MIIGLVGKKHSGKTTVAKMFRKHAPFITLAFADALKLECANILGITPEQLEAEKERFRTFLQFWGSEWRRGNDPNYWIDQVDAFVKFTPEENIIISDVRFRNEADYVLKNDGVLVRITRPLVSDDLHSSETEQDNISCQYTISNDGSLDQLKIMVAMLWTKLNANPRQPDIVA